MGDNSYPEPSKKAERGSKWYVFDKNNRYHRWIRTACITIASLVIFILIWWDLSLVLNIAAVPTPVQVWNAAEDLFRNGDAVTGLTMWANIRISLLRFLEGFILALAVAIPIGLLMGYSKTFKEFLDPVFEILRPIAPIAWAPVLLFATGYTWGPVLVVFIGILFPLVTNTVFGVKKIDRSLIDAAKTSGYQVFYKVMFPCAVPYIMNGIRVGSGIGWMCIVASELYASYGGGIGYFVGIQASVGYWPNVFVGILVIAVLGILTTGVFDYLYRIITRRMGME